MNDPTLLSLENLILPSYILSRFSVVKVEATSETIFIHPDDMTTGEYKYNPNIEFKNSSHL